MYIACLVVLALPSTKLQANISLSNSASYILAFYAVRLKSNRHMALCVYAFLLMLTAETHLPFCQLARHQVYASDVNLWAPCILYIGQAFRYSPENVFYVFNQQK